MSKKQTNKFTPGPWSVMSGLHTETTDFFDEGDRWFNISNEDGTIADILHGRCLSADEDEAKANARLIAAAPDMYAFIESVAKGQNGELKSEFINRIMKKAEKLLKPLNP